MAPKRKVDARTGGTASVIATTRTSMSVARAAFFLYHAVPMKVDAVDGVVVEGAGGPGEMWWSAFVPFNLLNITRCSSDRLSMKRSIDQLGVADGPVGVPAAHVSDENGESMLGTRNCGNGRRTASERSRRK